MWAPGPSRQSKMSARAPVRPPNRLAKAPARLPEKWVKVPVRPRRRPEPEAVKPRKRQERALVGLPRKPEQARARRPSRLARASDKLPKVLVRRRKESGTRQAGRSKALAMSPDRPPNRRTGWWIRPRKGRRMVAEAPAKVGPNKMARPARARTEKAGSRGAR